jgi:hypothetical protein
MATIPDLNVIVKNDLIESVQNMAKRIEQVVKNALLHNFRLVGGYCPICPTVFSREFSEGKDKNGNYTATLCCTGCGWTITLTKGEAFHNCSLGETYNGK